MNRATFVGALASVFLLTVNCSQQGPTGGGEGGSGGTTTSSGGSGGSGEGGSGGTDNSGGTTSSGGTVSSGGSAGSGSGGTSEKGGSSGGGGSQSGGSSASGGSNEGGTSAKGGATSGGGTVAAGGSGGSGGAATGGTTAKGGTTGSGGAVASGGTTTSTGGTTGTGGSTGSLAATVVPDLAKGFYWEGTCGGTITVDGHNCPMTGTGSSCPPNGRDIDTSFKVGGDSGKKYTVTLEVRGVVGTRCYQGGTPASTASLKTDDYNNWWYAGGTPYNATGWWNTYELQVTPATGDKDVYYFNHSSNSPSSGGDCEKEASYLVGYTASFKVMGGGSLRFRIHDNNCKAMQNCGKVEDKSAPCDPRKVDLSKMTVQPPTTVPAASQPPKNENKWYPQWMWVVATSVTPV